MTLIRITWKLLVLLTALIFVGTLHAADKTGQDEWRFASYGKAAKGSVTMDSNTLTIKTENTKMPSLNLMNTVLYIRNSRFCMTIVQSL